MTNENKQADVPRHLKISNPSLWVRRFASLIPAGGVVLDLACGGGRHSRHLLDGGYKVVALDRTTEPVADLRSNPACEVIEADLESGQPVFSGNGPLAGRCFDGVVVVNYLHRDLFPALIAALAPGGVLIYETFARGNEVYTRPRNPDHLLRSGELLKLAVDDLQVVAFEHGIVETGPLPGVIQRICAVKPDGPSEREDGEPTPRPVLPK